jgi:PAS domain S-box-containing protein
VVLDPEWRVVFANAAVEQLQTRTPAKLLGCLFWDEWPDVQGSELEKRLRHAMTERISFSLERFYPPASDLCFEICVFPFEEGIAIEYHDVTRFRRREHQLREYEEDLGDFLEQAAIPMHCISADGRIEWANEAQLSLLGYTREEYIGHPIEKFHADSDNVASILQRLKDNDQTAKWETRLRCKDGSLRHVLITSNVHWRDGELRHVRCFTRDITERTLVDEVQQRLAAIVESSDDAMISKNLQGIILSWNGGAERIFGYRAEEVIGKHVSILAAPDRLDEIPNILGRIAQGDRVDHYVTKRKTKDGRVLSISLTVSPIRDSSGTIIGASKVARDITESERSREALREINEQLRRANSDLQQFAFSAAHDLQEPLRSFLCSRRCSAGVSCRVIPARLQSI